MNPGSRKIAVLVSNDLSTDQRVYKVCEFLKSEGFSITLLGRLLPSSPPLQRSYPTKRFRLLFNKGPLFYAALNFRLFWHLLTHRYHWILANDLDTLPAAFLASKLRKTQLVYDSHEYFCGVPELEQRPKIQKIWRRIEQYIFPKLNKVYTVNASIANLYRREYGKDLVVVRNISPRLDSSRIKLKPWPFDAANKTILLIQGAGINVDRGAEEAVLAMQDLPNCLLVFIGNGDVLPKLKSMTSELGLEKQVFFLGKLPYPQMMSYTIQAHIGLSLDKPISDNYIFSLPNKLFDYIQANLPVITSDVFEVKKIVVENEVGLVLPEVTPEAIAHAVTRLIDDNELMERFRNNASKAAQILCWENEVQELKKVYSV